MARTPITALIIALGLVACGGARPAPTAGGPLVIPDDPDDAWPPWPGAPPTLEADVHTAELAFVTTDAVRRGHPTIALSAAYRALPAQIARYEDLASAILIVAVDATDGDVYASTGRWRGDHDTHVVDLSAQPTPSALQSSEGTFHVDLRRQVYLPPEAGTYWVFLWIEGVTSPAQRVEVPAGGTDPGRARTRVVLPEGQAPGPLALAPDGEASVAVTFPDAPAGPGALIAYALPSFRIAGARSAGAAAATVDLGQLLAAGPEAPVRWAIALHGGALTEPLGLGSPP